MSSWKARLSVHVRKFFFVYTKFANMPALKPYMQKNYDELKLLNPSLQLLMRPALTAKPHEHYFIVRAEYDWGQYRVFDLTNKAERDIEEALKQSVEIGKNMPRAVDTLLAFDMDILPGYTQMEIDNQAKAEADEKRQRGIPSGQERFEQEFERIKKDRANILANLKAGQDIDDLDPFGKSKFEKLYEKLEELGIWRNFLEEPIKPEMRRKIRDMLIEIRPDLQSKLPQI